MRAASEASSSSVRTAMAAGAVRSGDSARDAVTTTVSDRTGSFVPGSSSGHSSSSACRSCSTAGCAGADSGANRIPASSQASRLVGARGTGSRTIGHGSHAPERLAWWVLGKTLGPPENGERPRRVGSNAQRER